MNKSKPNPAVLFVCMGNICRSPMGEAVLIKMLQDNHLESKVNVDSAGIIDYHEGELADRRMRMHAEKRAYQLVTRSRPVKPEDGYNFDIIVAMDSENRRNLLKILPSETHHKIVMMNDFSINYKGEDVPDPYYGGEKGFELVIDMLEEANVGLLEKVKTLL